MSDEYKVQLSTTVNGNLLNFRGESVPDLTGQVQQFATELDNIVTALVQIKEGIILKDLFTGTASPKGPSNSSNTPNNSGSDSGTPRCKHGEMKDLTSKNYKSTHYCPEPDRDKQCKPVNLRS